MREVMERPKLARRGRARKIVVYVVAVILALIIWLPYVNMFFTSIQWEEELRTTEPHLLPRNITLQAYRRIFSDGKLTRAIKNSIVVSFSTTAIVLVAGSLGAYALGRLRFPGQRVLYLLLMIIYMLPGIAMLIPLLILLKKLHLVDRYGGMILAFSAFLLPLVTWFLKGLFEAVPPDLENAARADGCSRLGALLRIILPLSAPGIAVTAIFAILTSWNELMFAKVIGVYRLKLVTVTIVDYISPYDLQFDYTSAASVITSAPLIAVVIVLQRYIVRGLTEGAIR